MSALRAYAVTSGWEGPFHLEEVLVAAGDRGDAIRHAEDAFAAAGQPICRAKMRIADLGRIAEGALAAPRRAGAALSDDWQPVDRRCDPVPGAG